LKINFYLLACWDTGLTEGKVDPDTLKIGELAKDSADYKVNSIQKKIGLALGAKIRDLNYYYKADNLNGASLDPRGIGVRKHSFMAKRL
jgi:hypothetical protein